MEENRNSNLPFDLDETRKKREIEKALGRTLRPGEFVYFIDANSQNLNPENFWLTNSKGIVDAEQNLKKQIATLIKNGQLKFSSYFGTYEIERLPQRKIIISPTPPPVELKPEAPIPIKANKILDSASVKNNVLKLPVVKIRLDLCLN